MSLRNLIRLVPLALLALPSSSFADDDGGPLIVRTLSGRADIEAACAVLGCQVVRALDAPPEKLFLVAVPEDFEEEDLVGDDDCEDDGGGGPFPGIVCAEPDQDVELGEGVGLDPGASAASVRDRLQDRGPIDYFGRPAHRGYATQPARSIVSLGEVQEERGLLGAGVVAVIDTGVDPSHPLLQPSLLPGYDFTRDLPSASELADLGQSTVGLLDAQAYKINQSTVGLLDQAGAALLSDPRYVAFGHGTMVAGVVHLVAPRARILPLKAFGADGRGRLSDILRAVYFAIGRAQVLQMSFSLSTPSDELSRAMSAAAGDGMALVASVGNDGQQRVVYPAAIAGVMGVAATTDLDARAPFSNYGPEVVWVAAPGEAVLTTYPFGTYAAAWGTSFSAPFVSGTIALLLEQREACAGSCPPASIADAIGEAEPLSPELGRGRLDVERAVEAWRLALGL